jgi:hypothetical protein
VTAPLEVVIDHLVLAGVDEADAPEVVRAFREHLAAELAGNDTDTLPVSASGGDEPDRIGRELAAAVARAVRR